jgi:NitT/TauT family transport system substrate-binding protein
MTASSTSIAGVSRRRALVTLTGSVALAGAPAFLRTVNAQGLTKVSLQNGWLAQAEQGGAYQALATGLYREAGLDVEIRPGGPQVNTVQLFLGGTSDFVEADSFRAFAFAKDKLPAVAVAAYFQKDPRVLLSHAGTGNDTLESLKGKPLLVATAGRQTYWLWLKARFGFTDDQLKPYAFNIQPWLVDKQVSMQGYVTSEPFAARKAGVDPVVHLLADKGYDCYQGVYVTSPKMIAEKSEVVQRFVDATARGWASYLRDPAAGNALIRRDNPAMGEDLLAYAVDTMRKSALIETAETRAAGIGTMSHERWKRFYDAMVAAGAQPPGVDIQSAYTLQFVNRKKA